MCSSQKKTIEVCNNKGNHPTVGAMAVHGQIEQVGIDQAIQQARTDLISSVAVQQFGEAVQTVRVTSASSKWFAGDSEIFGRAIKLVLVPSLFLEFYHS